MNKMREHVKEKIIELAAYYDKNLTRETLDLYGRYLEDLDPDSFDAAIDRHIQTSEWMPKVSQIREAAMENFMRKAGVPSPAEAWGEVSLNLRQDTEENFGTLTSVNRINDHQWSHPLVKQAAEQIGWLDLWLTKDNNITANRARFMDAYRDLVKGLKEHYMLTPDLRQAIDPPAQPLLIDPDPETREIAPDKKEFGYNGFSRMPAKAQEKFRQLQGKMEVTK